MGQKPKPIPVSLDGGGWRSLVSFAVWTRIDLLGHRKDFAAGLDVSLRQLTSGLSAMEPAMVAAVERYLVLRSCGAAPGDRTLLAPMLSSLFREVSGSPLAESATEVQPAWFMDLASSGPPRSSVEVFARAAALQSLLNLSSEENSPERKALLSGARGRAADETVKYLLALTGAPGRKGVRAVHFLARLSSLALPDVEKEIWQSPVGYRAVRVLGRILQNEVPISREDMDNTESSRAENNDLTRQVGDILLRLDENRPIDAYPARSLWVECMRWAPNEWGWVANHLRNRSLDSTRPVRERMYAAVLLRERIDDSNFADVLKKLKTEGRNSGQEGLTFVVSYLDGLSKGESPGLKWFGKCPAAKGGIGAILDWPSRRNEVGVVNDALRIISEKQTIPHASVDGMQRLFAEAALQPDGTRRRRAADVLDAAGLGEPTVDALKVILMHSRAPSWQKEQAAFLIGHLQAKNSLGVLTEVIDAVEASTLHAVFWAIGDIYGTGRPSANEDELVIAKARQMATECGTAPAMRWAATYLLCMCRRPHRAQDLAKLSSNEFDKATRAFALWGQRLLRAEEVRHRLDSPRCIADNRTLPEIVESESPMESPPSLPESRPRSPESAFPP